MTTTAAGPLCRLEGRARALADAARSYTADPVRRADIDRLRARIEWNIGSATVGHRILLQGARDVAGTGPDRACEMAMIAAAAATFGADSGIDIDPTEFIGDTNLVGSPRTRCFALLLAGFADVGHGRLADPAGCFRQAFADCDPAGDVDLLSNLGIMYADPASLAAGASGCVAADYLSQLDPMSGDDEGAAVDGRGDRDHQH